MLSYLQKFNELPEEIKSQVSSEKAMENISALEKKYGFSLATVVMRVMVREISILDLAKFFVFENKLDMKQSEKLVEELKEKVFFGVANYLGFSFHREKNNLNIVNNPDVFLEEEKKEPKVVSSAFFFSSEDEEEVKKLAKKLEGFKNEKEEVEEVPQIDIYKIAEKVIKDSNTSFGSQELIDRFKNIIKTYLKGVRNRIDAKHALTKLIKDGGLEISDIYADNILSIADFNKKEEEEKLAKEKKEKRFGIENIKKKREHGGLDLGARDLDYDFSEIASRSEELKEEKVNMNAEKEILETRDSGVEIKNENINIGACNFKSEKDNSEEKKKRDIKSSSQQVMINPPRIKDIAKAGGKVKMEDVKYVPKLTGPIDELREMDLTNFRRLSSDPHGAIQKINDKIDFLEEESYSQRLKGIKAWRESPINKMYLETARKSIEGEGSIKDVIKAKNINNNNFLSEEEIEAIMELNRKLRF